MDHALQNLIDAEELLSNLLDLAARLDSVHYCTNSRKKILNDKKLRHHFVVGCIHVED